MGTNLWNISWTLSFGVISVASIAGNAITIFIFLKKRPLTWPKCLLISLAVADFLVGLITVPFYISSFWIFEEFDENVVLRASLDCIDMFTGFASIFTLAVIALERLYAIGWPLRHRALRNEIYFAAIATPWLLSFTVAWIIIIFQYITIEATAFLILLSVFLLTPIIVTSMAYILLWTKTRSRLRTRHHIQEERNLRLAKTVAIVTGAFLITWLPFELFLLSMNLCISCRVILVGMVLKLLQYGNSVVNIIIYCFGNAEYRAAFLAIFRSCRHSCQKHRKVLQSSVLRITVRNGTSTDNL
ncbi:octopamine receptor beta-2R-like [Acropora palmata]|uniref:octopamine receptor beta-2R-like n=1 Tax=Acropora palmata TaxID=6131 RepID=UPI003DA12AC2